MGATPSTWSLSTTSTVSMTRERAPALPLTERQRDERPPARFGSSPEYGLPKSDTNLAARLAAAGRCPDGRGARRLGVAARPAARFLLGESAGLRYPTSHSPSTQARSGTLSATPRLPRIGGPRSTARGLSTVLQALLLARVRGGVRLPPLAEHVHVVAGHLFAAGIWLLPTWRVHRLHCFRSWVHQGPVLRGDGAKYIASCTMAP